MESLATYGSFAGLVGLPASAQASMPPFSCVTSYPRSMSFYLQTLDPKLNGEIERSPSIDYRCGRG